jgi:SAM-dependent methyltransferase
MASTIHRIPTGVSWRRLLEPWLRRKGNSRIDFHVAGETTRDTRRQREADFHDKWAGDVDVGALLVDETFTAVTALENQHVLDVFGDVRGLRVLDYGSGAAEGGVFLAKRGAQVVAVDVSQGMLDVAQRLAHHHGVAIETRRVEGDRIPADTSEFDRVYGNGVLHHVPLAVAIPELARITRPSGVGCFIEPLPYNPLINVYRRVAKEVRTADEQPLSFADVDRFKSHFGEVTHREFWFTALAVFLKFYLWDRVDPNRERYWKRIYTEAPKIAFWFTHLKRLDERILSRLPLLGRYCWNTVITVAQPLTPEVRTASADHRG